MRNEATNNFYTINSELTVRIRALIVHFSGLRLNDSLTDLLSELRVLVNNRNQSSELEEKYQAFLEAYKKHFEL